MENRGPAFTDLLLASSLKPIASVALAGFERREAELVPFLSSSLIGRAYIPLEVVAYKMPRRCSTATSRSRGDRFSLASRESL
jgi:hypothetical protein